MYTASCYGLLVIVKAWGVFQDKNKQNGAKHRHNPRGKPGSVCFPSRHLEMNSPFSRTIT
jgi:hypothetical protein